MISIKDIEERIINEIKIDYNLDCSIKCIDNVNTDDQTITITFYYNQVKEDDYIGLVFY